MQNSAKRQPFSKEEFQLRHASLVESVNAGEYGCNFSQSVPRKARSRKEKGDRGKGLDKANTGLIKEGCLIKSNVAATGNKCAHLDDRRAADKNHKPDGGTTRRYPSLMVKMRIETSEIHRLFEGATKPQVGVTQNRKRRDESRGVFSGKKKGEESAE